MAPLSPVQWPLPINSAFFPGSASSPPAALRAHPPSPRPLSRPRPELNRHCRRLAATKSLPTLLPLPQHPVLPHSNHGPQVPDSAPPHRPRRPVPQPPVRAYSLRLLLIQGIKGSYEQNHGNMRQRRIVFHKLANFVAISYRHEYVSQYQIRPQIGNLPYRGLAIANGNHVYALIFQGQTHHLLDVAVVVRNQNPGHRTSSGRYRCRPTHDCTTVLEHSK